MVCDADLRPIVGIHQPNFFPWLGYFHKLRWSDTFVLLDDAQIQKTGGSVTNRATLASQGKEVVFSAPILRDSSAPRIDQVRFASGRDFRVRLAMLIRQAYAKARFMPELGERILALVANPTPLLGEYNASAIRAIASMLGLEARIVASSTFATTTSSTERLTELVRHVAGRTYLAGSGAANYQEDALFLANHQNVWLRVYTPPLYDRGNEPQLAGLSILDPLLHIGIEETRRLLDAPLDPGQLQRAAVGAS